MRGDWNRVDREELSRELEIWRSGPITREEIIARLSEASPTFQRALEEEEEGKKRKEGEEDGMQEEKKERVKVETVPEATVAALAETLAGAVAAGTGAEEDGEKATAAAAAVKST